jgi:hypothetical protein
MFQEWENILAAYNAHTETIGKLNAGIEQLSQEKLALIEQLTQEKLALEALVTAQRQESDALKTWKGKIRKVVRVIRDK